MRKILVLILIGLSCCGDVRAAVPGKTDSLAVYIQQMDLGEDGGYAAIMASRKHPAGRLAPEAFRDYLTEMEPQRIHFCQGVDVEAGLLTFWWRLDKFAVKATLDSMLIYTTAFFKALDWTRSEGLSAQELQFESAEGSRRCRFHLWDLSHDEDANLNGGKVLFQISFQSSLPSPLISALLKNYPAVFAPTFPSSLMKILKKRTFCRISYGGAWDQYYVWNLEVPCQTEENYNALRTLLIKTILSNGYRFDGETDGVSLFKLSFTDHTSLIYLSGDENEILKLRFQANA